MSATDWQQERTGFERRLGEAGARSDTSLANASGSILLAHTKFAAYEGIQGGSPYLMISLCTGQTGRIATRSERHRLDGFVRPGSFGLGLPNLKAEGLWPGVQMLGIAIDPAQLGGVDAKAMESSLAHAASTLR